jgi:hypothetical protein
LNANGHPAAPEQSLKRRRLPGDNDFSPDGLSPKSAASAAPLETPRAGRGQPPGLEVLRKTGLVRRFLSKPLFLSHLFCFLTAINSEKSRSR